MASGSDPAQLSGLAGWVVDTIEALGPVGVGALVALETVFPPIPSEVVLPVAGLLAGQGRMPVALALVGATVGSLVGAALLYWAGARLGQRRLERIVDRVPLLDREDLHRAETWFDRHGDASVLIGRAVPVVRSLVSVPAGVERMPVLHFLVFTAVGSAVYNSALIAAGYLLGDRWTKIGEYSDYVNYAIYALILGAVVVFVRRRVRRRAAGPAGRRTDGARAGQP